MLCAIILLAGCATPAPVTIAVPFDQVRANTLLEPGTGQIHGTALIWLSTGAVISCAGENVTLYPATRYANEWVRLNYDGVPPAKLQPSDVSYRSRKAGPAPAVALPSFLAASRSTHCDNDNHFQFDQVSDGEFYVVAHLVWQQQIWDEVSFFYGNKYYDREGTVLKKVRVHGGQVANADMKWSSPNSRFNIW